MNRFIIFILLLFFYTSHSQVKTINGFVKSDGNNISGILIELKSSKKSFFAVSSNTGKYQFKLVDFKLNDTIKLLIDNVEFGTFSDSIFIYQNKDIIFDIILVKKNQNILNEVIIKSENVIHDANKATYKINSKDYIKNASSTEALSKIPNVFFNQQSLEAFVEGNLKAKIFLDGNEIFTNELKSIKVVQIDKIEIISNPSSLYGTDFIGAVINIVTKETIQSFYDGSFALTGGLNNNYWSASPTVEFKRAFYYFKTNINYLENNQITSSELVRNDLNGSYSQKNINFLQSRQGSINTKCGITFSKKANLLIIGNYSGYVFDGNSNGTSSLNDSFKNLSNLENTFFDSQVIFKCIIDVNKTFYFKNRFNNLIDNNIGEYTNNGSNSNYNLQSKTATLITNLNYSNNLVNFIKIKTGLIFDLKHTLRQFDFKNGNFYLNQNIIDATFEINNKWNKNLSTRSSITYEYLNNLNNQFSNNYNFILPTLSAIYRFKDEIRLKFGYSKKLLRPNGNDLNSELIIANPGFGIQGNSNLSQQIRNYFSLMISKDYDIDSVSLKLYNESINNAIDNVYILNETLLIKTIDNIASYNSSGFDFNYVTKFFKKIDLNFNAGVNYVSNSSDNYSFVITNNSGLSYNSTIYLSSFFLKNKLSTSFSASYQGPQYSLVSKNISYPYLDFSLNTNILKNKVSVKLYFQNLLGIKATITKDESYSENFRQTITSKNNFTNLLLTLIYNFGKKIESNLEEKNLENNDIRK